MAEINFLIKEKIGKYSPEIQKLVLKAIELAGFSQETAISDQLEGILRDITKESN